jgi:hypothetical protein
LSRCPLSNHRPCSGQRWNAIVGVAMDSIARPHAAHGEAFGGAFHQAPLISSASGQRCASTAASDSHSPQPRSQVCGSRRLTAGSEMLQRGHRTAFDTR